MVGMNSNINSMHSPHDPLADLTDEVLDALDTSKCNPKWDFDSEQAHSRTITRDSHFFDRTPHTHLIPRWQRVSIPLGALTSANPNFLRRML